MNTGAADSDPRDEHPGVAAIEVVADRTDGSRPDEGFLRVRRLQVRNVYTDGSRSVPYACDVVSRASVDAVAVLLYEIDGARRVRVVLKAGARPPVWLRREKDLVQPDAFDDAAVPEMCAGMLERGDTGPDGIARRAAAEADEECGFAIDAADVEPLGGASFPSPGVTDEKVFFRAAPVRLDERRAAGGDGSVMEEGTEVLVLELREAIRLCRTDVIPDMKTELALLRLCDHIGYLPQLDRFVDELPADQRTHHDRLGVEAAETTTG